jgi:transporter family-2 protein
MPDDRLMSEDRLGATGFAGIAGICGALQPKINASLAERLDSSLLAGLVNFLVALALVGLALSRRAATRRTLRDIRQWDVPRWTFGAGSGGALVVLAGVVTIQELGVAMFSVAFFAGQIVFSLGIDHLGVAPGPPRPITFRRGQAAALAGAAVALVQLERPPGDSGIGYLLLLVFAAGGAVAFQSAFNARIVVATDDFVAATAVNVVVGSAALVLAAALAGVETQGAEWPFEPWHYVGGLLGVTTVFSLAMATVAAGALRVTVIVLAVQLAMAFVGSAARLVDGGCD